MRLYRRVDWGATATFHMLDTRQYRDDPGLRDGRPDCPRGPIPSRSMPGSAQERWLAAGLRRSRARWDVLGQQVFFAQLDLTPGAGRGFDRDTWDGYPASRDRVVDSWVTAGVRNAVVLTGDIHSHWAADIRRRWDDPDSPVVGTELVDVVRLDRRRRLGGQHRRRRCWPRTRTCASSTTAAGTCGPASPRPS